MVGGELSCEGNVSRVKNGGGIAAMCRDKIAGGVCGCPGLICRRE